VIRGSCMCGAVHYVLRGEPLRSDYCHCSRCRKFSGSQADPGMTVRLAEIEISGREELTVYRSERLSDRAFCRRCGSSLFAGRELFSAETFSVCMGSLDDDPRVRPALRKGVAWNAPWLPIDPGLPCHAEGPSED
jgi:hypothetical protein